ncbi:PHD finger protein 14 isoform X2 [Condylostylus longicornis]|uniref:PHD finger protein 14 isoform X2 n=1 Tax=Condylostylus longicornis TaxID=2530218 RepID=UPI00244DF097|nr:PHD finger protein 14 isoform X2 [Condylostylus longicornis]
MAPLNKNSKNKARLPKMTTQTLLDFDLGESSSDSDFRIEDHDDDSDDDFSVNSNDSDGDMDDDDDDDEENDTDSDDSDSNKETAKAIEKIGLTSTKMEENSNVKDIISKTLAGENTVSNLKIDLSKNLICCACLGDRSDDSNEIVECDGCGVSVHEGCYGISDTASISSTNSSCSTEPWFCEACKAGVIEPSCELCPGKGGIFKETEVGRWVHLICALYVPGVAFGEVDHLSSVTLFEMQYSKWGAKQCTLCEDDRYARTGVCIGCDAGMCKTFFHVTCAQAAGFLSEPHSDEADHADPFYAHCKVHSDKTMIKHRKRNYNLMKLRMQQIRYEKEEHSNEKQTPEQIRIQRKLVKHQNKYKGHKETKNDPWVPTQKIPRLLTTSATAVRRLHAKAAVMGIDTELLEFQEAQVAAITDVRKKWHVPPAFSVEFVAYYLDRISRTKELKLTLEKNVDDNKKLLIDQAHFREEYDKKIKINAELLESNVKLKSIIEEMHKQISLLCPNKQLQSIDNIGRPIQQPLQCGNSTQIPHITTTAVAIPRTMTVPTAAARKMGVGFPLNNLPGDKRNDTNRVLSTQIQNKNQLVHNCGICKGCHDQHLLAKCDTCHLHYHLGCLNPPLTRHPKKSKLYGWQCSECDKSDDSDVIVELPPGPRRSRTKFSKDGKIVPADGNSSLNSLEEDSITNNIDKPQAIQTTKRKSTDRRSSITQPLSPKMASIATGGEVAKAIKKSEKIDLKPIVYNGQIRSPKEATPPKSPKKSNTKTASIGNRKDSSQSPSKIVNYSVTEKSGDISIEKRNNSIGANQQNKIEISAKKAKKHLGISKSPPPVTTSSLTITTTKVRPSSSGSIPIKAIFDPLSLDNESPLAENVVIKPIRTPKRKKDNEEDVDPLQISPNKLNCNVNLNISNNENIVLNDDQSNVVIINDGTVGGYDVVENSDNISHKINRKKRKEKHKNRCYSDSDKSPSKEHKRKRKKKNHDNENPKDLSSSTSSVPKIKIKDNETKLNNPNMPTTSTPLGTPANLNANNTGLGDLCEGNSPTKRTPKPINRDIPKSLAIPAKQTASSPKRTKKSRMSTNSNISTSNTSVSSQLLTSTCSLNCTTCQLIGTIQNSVQCDECYKVYHFSCLDPPVKKTPKRRGYSWHCADCDPTDHEGS